MLGDKIYVFSPLHYISGEKSSQATIKAIEYSEIKFVQKILK
jgi:hypothetical protein